MNKSSASNGFGSGLGRFRGAETCAGRFVFAATGRKTFENPPLELRGLVFLINADMTIPFAARFSAASIRRDNPDLCPWLGSEGAALDVKRRKTQSRHLQRIQGAETPRATGSRLASAAQRRGSMFGNERFSVDAERAAPRRILSAGLIPRIRGPGHRRSSRAVDVKLTATCLLLSQSSRFMRDSSESKCQDRCCQVNPIRPRLFFSTVTRTYPVSSKRNFD
jgi:hypothetical protein